jgi:hypothetical protein
MLLLLLPIGTRKQSVSVTPPFLPSQFPCLRLLAAAANTGIGTVTCVRVFFFCTTCPGRSVSQSVSHAVRGKSSGGGTSGRILANGSSHTLESRAVDASMGEAKET